MSHLENDLLYSGTSGLQLPVPKYLFPPPYENVSRLTYYATLFNSIEINSSFYKIPRAVTVTKWAASVPNHFKFTFKLWKGITHTKGLNFNEADVALFLDSIHVIKQKKGCLLIQLPPSLGIANKIQLNALLSCIKENDVNQNWSLAVEFRNNSWYHEDVYDILNFYKATLVVHDMPKSATPLLKQSLDFVYIRFHGPSGNYRESYSEDFLNEYANVVHDWTETGKTVYVYFNNTMGDAINNLKYLNALIQDKKSIA